MIETKESRKRKSARNLRFHRCRSHVALSPPFDEDGHDSINGLRGPLFPSSLREHFEARTSGKLQLKNLNCRPCGALAFFLSSSPPSRCSYGLSNTKIEGDNTRAKMNSNGTTVMRFLRCLFATKICIPPTSRSEQD
jgi:hypothetical protein